MLNVSQTELRRLGLKPECLRHSNTLNELSQLPPNIVIGRAKTTCGYIQNNYKEQRLQKNHNYVMSLGVYLQLRKNLVMGRKILTPSNLKFSTAYRKYNGQDLHNKKLLVWRTGGIGDLFFIQPNLRFLKEKYPTCKIIFACGPQYQKMVSEWDCVDQIVDLPFETNLLFETHYHVMFEGVIERCKEAEKINAYKLFTRWMGLNLDDKLLQPKHKVDPKRLEYVKQVLVDNHWFDKPFILFQSRASSPIRTPHPEVTRKITNKLTRAGYNVIFTDSPHSISLYEKLLNSLENQDKIFNFIPFSKNISDTIALASLSNCILSVDSALVHIGGALRKPVVGIYGPFLGELRLSTYEKADWVNCIYACAPCFTHGHQPCKLSFEGYPLCFNNLNNNELFQKVEKMYEK